MIRKIRVWVSSAAACISGTAGPWFSMAQVVSEMNRNIPYVIDCQMWRRYIFGAVFHIRGFVEVSRGLVDRANGLTCRLYMWFGKYYRHEECFEDIIPAIVSKNDQKSDIHFFNDSARARPLFIYLLQLRFHGLGHLDDGHGQNRGSDQWESRSVSKDLPTAERGDERQPCSILIDSG